MVTTIRNAVVNFILMLAGFVLIIDRYMKIDCALIDTASFQFHS